MMNTLLKSLLAGTTGAALLSACAGSPPASYYTLQEAANAQVQTVAVSRGEGARDAVIEVLPVSVPMQVDQPQIMLRDAAGTVTPRYSDRWSAPLADELRSALSDRLTRRLGVADVYEVKAARGEPVWRIQVDVQRFDSVLGDAAIIDATWRLRAINMKAPASLCRTSIRQPVAGVGVSAVVAAHQRAVSLLGDAIAARVSGATAQDTPDVTTQCSTISDGAPSD